MEQGSSAARLEQWLKEYGDALYRYALTRVRRPEVAEDLVQETFLAAFQRLHTFQGLSSPLTWLTGILRHKVLDYFRRQVREGGEEELDLKQPELEPGRFTRMGRWSRPVSSWTQDPHEVLRNRDFQKVLQRCLDELPEPNRIVFLLKVLEELPTREICKEMGLTPTHLWVRTHRARSALRRCLERHWFREGAC